jgi:1,4-dihydroxy-2-naphthoate octaprenyltransferase
MPGVSSPEATSATSTGPLVAWIMACRPKTLPVAMAPVLVGTASAYSLGGFRELPALATLAGALLLQIAANLANDVFDHERGVDNEERLGPTRVVQAGLLSARSVRIGVGVALTMALFVGCYLAWIGGWPIVLVGLAAMAAAVAYTAGPYPLGYHGLGDPFVFVFFGWVAVLGTVYLQLGAVPVVTWWLAVPIGSLATAVLVVNNLRDLATDARSGKRTLAVRWGKQGALLEFWSLLAVAYLVPGVLLLAERAQAWLLLPWVTLPLALRLALSVKRDTGTALNRRLAQTAGLLLTYAMSLSAGIIVGAWSR